MVPGWYAVFAGPHIAQIKMLHSHERAETLHSHILDHLAREPQPELADVCIVSLSRRFQPANAGIRHCIPLRIWA